MHGSGVGVHNDLDLEKFESIIGHHGEDSFYLRWGAVAELDPFPWVSPFGEWQVIAGLRWRSHYAGVALEPPVLGERTDAKTSHPVSKRRF